MRTFQEIYDFCNHDPTFRTYYDAPNQFSCNGSRQYRYFHGNLGDGRTRCGSYLYYQARTQLERFLRNDLTSFNFHLSLDDYQLLDSADFARRSLNINMSIDGSGVRISLTHPFSHLFENKRIVFYARSHRPFTPEGLREEVQAYLEKHILFAPGHFRDLQIAHYVPKKEFVTWYQHYRKEKHMQAEQEHQNMVDRYRRITFDDAYSSLALSGIFSDFNMDDAERDQTAEDLIRIANR